MEFRFTNEYKTSKIDEIISYLIGPRLWIPKTDYPDFFDWAGKVWQELNSGEKRAMVAFHGSEIAGVTIYQKHESDSEALEVKNLTVRPDKRGRYVASFLMRNTEIEGGKELNSKHVVCDAKARNIPIRFFLMRHGYKITNHADLYNLNTGEDIVYRKRLNTLS